jgi:head-tail adaptor
MLTARRRNNLVLIQHKVLVPGPLNDQVQWLAYAQTWVSIDPQRGREVFASDERTSVVTHVVRGDFMELSGVDETMRIIHASDMSYAYGGSPAGWSIRPDARVFDILAVMPDFETRGDVMISAAEKGIRFGDLPHDIPQ